MDITDPWTHLSDNYLANGRIRATIYRHGAILTGWPSRWPDVGSNGPRARRGIITSQSARSLIRAAFAIRAAEVDWRYMLTLTFRVRIPTHKEALRWFCRHVWHGRINEMGVGWFLEYQDRDVEHYHLLMDEEAMQAAVWPETAVWRKVSRRGQAVSVLAGAANERIALIWGDCVPDNSPEFRAFQRGGILERLANPDRCHDYLANYCRKLSQKILPDGFEGPGRWWWISDRARPVARGHGIVYQYPFDRPMSMIRDADKLGMIRVELDAADRTGSNFYSAYKMAKREDCQTHES